MSKERDAGLLLEDILISATRILEYTEDKSFEEFLDSQITIDAVIRNFLTIGEAASRFDGDFRSEHPEIEWRRIVGLRNKLIHDYDGINYDLVWEIINNYLEELQFQVKNVLAEIDSQNSNKNKL